MIIEMFKIYIGKSNCLLSRYIRNEVVILILFKMDFSYDFGYKGRLLKYFSVKEG